MDKGNSSPVENTGLEPRINSDKLSMGALEKFWGNYPNTPLYPLKSASYPRMKKDKSMNPLYSSPDSTNPYSSRKLVASLTTVAHGVIMKTNQMMSVDIGGFRLDIEHKTGLGNLTSLWAYGNSLRVARGKAALDLDNYLRQPETVEYLIETERYLQNSVDFKGNSSPVENTGLEPRENSDKLSVVSLEKFWGNYPNTPMDGAG